MITKMYLKEVKQFFRKPFNVVFLLVAPMVLILLMGYAMSNMIGTTKTGNSSNTMVLYLIEDDASFQYQQKFTMFKEFIENGMEIHFQEIKSYEQGSQEVDRHNAIALIQVSKDNFYYYRSPYNEPTESKMLRTAYNTFLGSSNSLVSTSYIEVKEVHRKIIDSYTYFTFAELGLIMIYISLIVGQSVFAEKETKTLERIYTSKANINKMLCSKILLGCTVSVIQILLVYGLSTLVLNVKWGNLFFLIFILYVVLGLFSSTLGAVLGIFIKKKASLNDRIMILAICIGFLGGGLTPLSFLDTVKVISELRKISPLYWVTNSAITLSAGKINEEFVIAISICLLLIAFLAGIYLLRKGKEKVQGVYVYE